MVRAPAPTVCEGNRLSRATSAQGPYLPLLAGLCGPRQVSEPLWAQLLVGKRHGKAPRALLWDDAEPPRGLSQQARAGEPHSLMYAVRKTLTFKLGELAFPLAHIWFFKNRPKKKKRKVSALWRHNSHQGKTSKCLCPRRVQGSLAGTVRPVQTPDPRAWGT